MVEKTIELTGTSANSIEDAVNLAMSRAAVTIEGIRRVEIAGVSATVENGAVASWQVKMKLTFTIQDRCTNSGRARRAMDAKVREVVPGIFLVHLPLPMKPTIVNVYLLHSGDEWALIDTGMNSADSIATFKDVLAAGRLRARATAQDHLHASPSRPLRHLEDLQGAHRRAALSAPRRVRALAALSAQRAARPKRCASSSPTASRCSASRTCRGRATSGAGSTSPRTPDVFIDDGDVIEVGDFRIQVVWTPGPRAGALRDVPARRSA